VKNPIETPISAEQIPIGSVANTHGLRGELYVHLLTTLDFKDLPALKILRVGDTDYDVLASRAHKGGFLARLQGVDTIEKAQDLRGSRVSIATAAFPKSKDFFLFEVLHYTVLDEAGNSCGVITGFETDGLQDRAILKDENLEYRIPFLQRLIKSRDDGSKTLVMQLAEGLRELNVEVANEI
jgi:16S rRNA processing protein RimM